MKFWRLAKDIWLLLTTGSNTNLSLNLDEDIRSKTLTGETMGTTVADNDLVYWDGDSWEECHYGYEAKSTGMIAWCKDASEGEVVLFGVIRNLSGYTKGDLLYVGQDGAITSTLPSADGTYVRCIGRAISSSVVIFRPEGNWTLNSGTYSGGGV